MNVNVCVTDGATSFVHGFPFCCIPLGLIYQKRPVLGVVYNPFIEYLVRPPSALYSRRDPRLTRPQYTGIEGQGSYLTRGTSQPQKLDKLEGRLVPKARWG